jgi:hypothetical protein
MFGIKGFLYLPPAIHRPELRDLPEFSIPAILTVNESGYEVFMCLRPNSLYDLIYGGYSRKLWTSIMHQTAMEKSARYKKCAPMYGVIDEEYVGNADIFMIPSTIHRTHTI